jgi:DNA-binding CsgD family transcriptional regulator
MRVGAAIAERESPTAAVRQLLDDAVAGRGGALFLVGEAGLGKTTMLDHAVVLAAGRLEVGVGRADVAEGALPFGLLSQALEPLLGPEVLIAGGERVAQVTVASRLYAILQRLREVAVRPLLIALDDAHWADPDSLTLLRVLCRRLSSLPVAVLVTARPWPPEMAGAAAELSHEGLAQLERLVPLSAEVATSMLVARIGHVASREDIESAVAACAGNPLLLDHVGSDLLVGRALPTAHGDTGSWASRLLLSRFTGVSGASGAYLRAASVLGGRFRPEVAAEVAALDPAEAASALDALAGAGLVVVAGDGWGRFSHDLVRKAIYDQVAPARAHLHEAAFRALLARKAPPAEAAEHAVLARLADPVAIATLAEAGSDALRSGAPGTARRHLEAAVGLGGQSIPVEVLLDLAQALRAAGDNQEAAAVCRELLGRPGLPVPVHVAGLTELSQAEFRDGHVDAAEARIDEAVALIETEPPDLAAVVLVDQAHLRLLRAGPRSAFPLATKARAVAAQVGGQTRCVADAAWGECAYLAGDPAGLEVAEDAARQARLAPRTPEVAQWSDPQVLYAELATWSERFIEAEALLVGIIAEAERKRYPMTLFESQYHLVEVFCRTGRLGEAHVAADQLLESAQLMSIALPLAISQKALVLLELGQLEEAASWCRQLEDLNAVTDWLGRVWSVGECRRGVLALRRGEAEAAAAMFGRMERSAARAQLLEPCIYPWAAPAICAYLACGRDDDAARVVEWLEPRAAALPARWPKAVAASGRAALAEREGDLDQAAEGFAHAVSLHHPAMAVARSQTLTDYGAFLLRQGQATAARPVLAEALALAEGCGAGWHARQARVAWRRAGGRSGTTPSGALTPQEKAVADLVRAGRTNREIATQLYLSVNTVQTHLAHVYRKLGINSRWQLIAGHDPGEG